MGIFALIALLLASIGVYGAMAYSIAQRTHEIGVRVALGAQQRDILRIAVGEGFMLVLSGIISGLIGAAILARFLSTMLFNVSPNDPFTFVAIPVLLASVALLACYIPARRATRVDPLVALRNE
jgi:putative ABC transport system permease protein